MMVLQQEEFAYKDVADCKALLVAGPRSTILPPFITNDFITDT